MGTLDPLETQPKIEGQSTSTQDSQVSNPEPAYRMSLMDAVQVQAAKPDLAGTVYQTMGINAPNVTLKGQRSNVADLKPGDLIGWKGGEEPDGRYVGNVAIYAGDGHILEKFYGSNRRRKLGPNEDVFGMPVNLPEDTIFP
jgi:hypothetical protein